ncbi:hypothetical protein BA011_17455 [Rhizobium leguminosarum]|uniref:Uncharacterized protein n=1 Tax=Rhizobium leguminosarum TaxID=384 RepID=A0A1B1CC76_RHILE|nr:hypothetical protein BA011_17455 [Rhizobium leguminosarum]
MPEGGVGGEQTQVDIRGAGPGGARNYRGDDASASAGDGHTGASADAGTAQRRQIGLPTRFHDAMLRRHTGRH